MEAVVDKPQITIEIYGGGHLIQNSDDVDKFDEEITKFIRNKLRDYSIKVETKFVPKG